MVFFREPRRHQIAHHARHGRNGHHAAQGTAAAANRHEQFDTRAGKRVDVGVAIDRTAGIERGGEALLLIPLGERFAHRPVAGLERRGMADELPGIDPGKAGQVRVGRHVLGGAGLEFSAIDPAFGYLAPPPAGTPDRLAYAGARSALSIARRAPASPSAGRNRAFAAPIPWRSWRA